jgi:hypothetical protein
MSILRYYITSLRRSFIMKIGSQEDKVPGIGAEEIGSQESGVGEG